MLGIDDGDFRSSRQEGTHHRPVVFDMPAEIAERIGVITANDGECVGWKRLHGLLASAGNNVRSSPTSGMRSQPGR